MSVLYLLFLSVLQGVTELFPVSSLGHTILLPAVFHHPLDRAAPQLLPFLVALHLGTAVALLAYFRSDWARLLSGAARSLRGERNSDGRLLGLVLLGSVPAGVVGLVLQHPLERLFSSPITVALVLMLNGALLFLSEQRLPPSHTSLEGLSARQALWVGAAQIGALIPGLSRSGLTLAAGMRAGLTREAAAEFAFLLGTPIILAAGVLELPKLARDHAALGSALLGGVLTGIAAWLSLRFLMRYLSEHRLTAFAGYCVAAGALSALALILFPLR